VTPGAPAVGATSVMVFCILLGLFLHGAASFLLFGVAATLAIYLVLIGGAYVVDGAPPASASALGTLNKVLLSSAGREDGRIVAVGVMC